MLDRPETEKEAGGVSIILNGELRNKLIAKIACDEFQFMAIATAGIYLVGVYVSPVETFSDLVYMLARIKGRLPGKSVRHWRLKYKAKELGQSIKQKGHSTL